MTRLKFAGTCSDSGKIQYPSRKDAKEGRRLMKGKGIPQSGIAVYQCQWCFLWHLGHLSASVRAGQQSREERYLEHEISPENGRTALSVAREVVFARAKDRCEVCGGRATDFSHRRTRSVKDEHTDSPENGLASCRACHAQMHRHPAEARRLGHHVSRYVPDPGKVPVHLKGAWWMLSRDGTMSLTDKEAH